MKLKLPEYLRPLVRVLDILFSVGVIGPVVVLYWVTTWKIFDIYITPENPRLSAGISFAIGFIGQFTFMFFQVQISVLLKTQHYKFVKFVITKVYVLLYAVTSISFWRGVWNFVDMISSDNYILVAMNAAQNILIMVISKTFRNTISTPFIVETDRIDDDFVVPTYFKRNQNHDQNFAFFFDCLCSLMITSMSAFVWRDIWDLTDDFLLPEDVLASAYTSIAIGCFLALICFVSEHRCDLLCQKFPDNKIYVHDAFIMVCLLSTVQIWRGMWIAMSHYIGDRKELVFLLNGICWKVLVGLNCVSTIAGRGIFLDAAESSDKCVKLPIDYFAKIIQIKSDELRSIENTVSTITKL